MVRPLHVWLASALFGCLACGEPQLHIALATPDGAPPPAGISELEVAVLTNSDLLASRREPYGDTVKLPKFEWKRDMWFYIAGLQGDVLLALAEEHPELPAQAQDCCITACFCTATQRDAGLCGCGSTTCDEGCTP